MDDFPSAVVQLTLEEWHDFASGFEDRHVFHHAGWIRALQETYHFPLRIYGVKDVESGQLQTALPFMRVLTYKGKRKWICLPFTDFFPVLGDIEQAVKLLKHLRATHQLRGGIEVRFELPKDEAFHYSIHQVCHAVDLRTEKGTLHQQIGRNHQKALRQGQRRGVSVDFPTSIEAMEIYYDLQLRTRQAKGLPTQPWKFFLNVHKYLIDSGENGRIVLAKNKFTVIGGKVMLFWGNTLTGKYSASNYAYLSFRPNQMVYWESILWGIDHGYEVYDLGKTTTDNDGLCRFKRGWTAVEKPLRYTYLGVDHNVEINEPTKNGLVALMSKFICRSPLFVSRLLGKLFYRFFA